MMGLKKALYIVINDFLGKLIRVFFIDIPLLILEIALSIFCLKSSFSQILNQECF